MTYYVFLRNGTVALIAASGFNRTNLGVDFYITDEENQRTVASFEPGEVAGIAETPYVRDIQVPGASGRR